MSNVGEHRIPLERHYQANLGRDAERLDAPAMRLHFGAEARQLHDAPPRTEGLVMVTEGRDVSVAEDGIVFELRLPLTRNPA